MFKVAICDDEQIIGGFIEEIIIDYKNHHGKAIAVEVYESAKALYIDMKKGEWFDLIFLDIQFEEVDGIQIGKSIRDELDNQIVQIVYISSIQNCSIELFEVRPMNFVEKPIQQSKIIKAIEKCMYLTGWNDACFEYKKGHQNYKIPRQNIIYFESVGRKIKIVTIQGEDYFYGKIEEIYASLKAYGFLDIHRSYVVNYNHIIEFRYEEVVIVGNISLPISQPRRKKIRSEQMNLIRYKNNSNL